MFILKKTLKDEFLITVVFCIILAVSIFLVIQEFSIARHLDFSSFIKDVPGPFKKLAEKFLVLNVFGGYLHIVAAVNWIIIAGIFVSLVSSSLISKESEKKTLPILLAHPVNRFQIILQKYAGFTLYLILICAFSFLGFYLGIYHGSLSVPYDMKLVSKAMLNGFSFFLALSGVGVLASVIFTEQKKASISTMLYFFLSYLSFFLGAFSPRWAVVKDWTLFRFFNTENLFLWGRFDRNDCIWLIGISAALFIVSSIIFQIKDINS